MDNAEKTLVQVLREMLRADYGVTNDAELDKAIKDMEPMDISVFLFSSAGKEQTA